MIIKHPNKNICFFYQKSTELFHIAFVLSIHPKHKAYPLIQFAAFARCFRQGEYSAFLRYIRMLWQIRPEVSIVSLYSYDSQNDPIFLFYISESFFDQCLKWLLNISGLMIILTKSIVLLTTKHRCIMK